jgi:hypothetical protein
MERSDPQTKPPLSLCIHITLCGYITLTPSHTNGQHHTLTDQARRLKELEQENAKLKRLVSELSLEKLVLKDIASGNF